MEKKWKKGKKNSWSAYTEMSETLEIQSESKYEQQHGILICALQKYMWNII